MRKRNFAKQVGVLLTEETYLQLVKVTDKAEVPLSEFIREIIEDKLNQITEKGE
jgi:predicted DNA-binding protein